MSKGSSYDIVFEPFGSVLTVSTDGLETEPLNVERETAESIVELLRSEGYDCRVVPVRVFDYEQY